MRAFLYISLTIFILVKYATEMLKKEERLSQEEWSKIPQSTLFEVHRNG